jgi:hypothetical protein
MEAVTGKVCIPGTCVTGSTDSSCKWSLRILELMAVVVFHKPSAEYLTPGIYPGVDYDPATLTFKANLTASDQSSALTVSLPTSPLLFGTSFYKEDVGLMDQWQSAYLPSGWYGVAKPGQTVWGAIPDKSQLPGSIGALSSVSYGK